MATNIMDIQDMGSGPTTDQQSENTNNQKPEALKSVQSVVDMNKPKIFIIEDSKKTQKVDKCCNKNVRIRLSRWFFITLFPCLFLVILTYERENDEVHLCELVGSGIICMYVVYFSTISVLFWTGARLSKNRSLFRVWTKDEAVPGWASMNIAANQQLFQFEAIQSISEFSAIDGGIPSTMLSNLGPFTWAIVMMHFASELHCNASVFTWDIADYVEIVGVTGLVMIGMFELDPYNKSMQMFHYVGALAGVGTIVGYVIQANSLKEATGDASYLAGPIVVCVIAFICFVGWQLSNKQTEREQKKIRKKHQNNKPNEEDMKAINALITRLSLQNVIFEGIFLFCGALSLALWLIHYDDNCCLGCAGARDELLLVCDHY